MTQLVEVSLEDLELAADNVRSETTDKGLEELAQSIASVGLLQPIVVSPPLADGAKRTVHHGARRLLAIDLINKDPAKYQAEPIRVLSCVERKYENDGERIAASLIENLQREDIDPIDEANGYFRLTAECAYSQSEIAKRIGRDRAHVSRYLSLLSLPLSVQGHIAEGNVTLERAWQLVKLADHPEIIEKLVNEVTGAVSEYQIADALSKQETRDALRQAAERVGQSTDLPIVYTGAKTKPKSAKPFAAMGKSIELSAWDGTVPEGTSYVYLTKEPWQDETSVKFFTDDETRIDPKAMGYDDRQRYESEVRKKNPDAEPTTAAADPVRDTELRRNLVVAERVHEARHAHQLARLTAMAHGKLTLANLVELVWPVAIEDYQNYAVDAVELVKVGRIKLDGVADVDDADLDELYDKVAAWSEDPRNHARFAHLVFLLLGRHEPTVVAAMDKLVPVFDEDAARAEAELAYDNLASLETTVEE